MRILLALGLITIIASPRNGAGAQTASNVFADSALRRIISDFGNHPPTGVRVRTPAAGRFEGLNASILGDSIVVTGESGSRAFATLDVDSLWVRSTASRALGVIAAIPCAIFGALVGSFIGSDPDGSHASRRGPIVGLLGALAGGATCGFVGAEIGSLIGTWRLEYPVDEDPAW